VFYSDVDVQRTISVCIMTSKLKAMGGCSSHHLQGAGAYFGGRTTGRTTCILLRYFFRIQTELFHRWHSTEMLQFGSAKSVYFLVVQLSLLAMNISFN